MLKNISKLGTVLEKSEQKSVNGGFTLIFCWSCEPLPPGYLCMNEMLCDDTII